MQRGRRKHHLNVVHLDVTRARPTLTPPTSLSATDRAMFKEIVANVHGKTFVKSDEPLLISYILIAGVIRKLASKAAQSPEPRTIMSLERMLRVQANVATKLRLSPQSRLDRKQAGAYAAEPKQDRPAWHSILDDDDD